MNNNNCLHIWKNVMHDNKTAIYICSKCKEVRIITSEYIDSQFSEKYLNTETKQKYNDGYNFCELSKKEYEEYIANLVDLQYDFNFEELNNDKEK